MMKKLLTIFYLLVTGIAFGQGFTYSYVDPCSKKLKTISLGTSESVTVNYLGIIGTFTQQDFQNGSFSNWIQTAQSQASSQPCDELKTQTQVSQNMFVTQNLISTLSSITAAATMSIATGNTMSNALGNSTSNANNGSETKKEKKERGSNTGSSSNQGSSNTNTTGSQGQSQGQNVSENTTSGGNQNSQGQSTSPGSGGNGGSQAQGSGSGSDQNGNSQGQSVPDNTKEQGNGGNGGTTNSISNAAESGSGGGSKVKVGSVIGTGDVVAIRSAEDQSNQFRGTFSVTKSNTNNTKAKGFLLNFTTQINNSNLTFYGSFTDKNKKNTLIIANSSMIDFERNLFNTTTALEARRFGKVTGMLGANFTVGGMAEKTFTNLSAVGGGFIPFKANKKISGTILLLGVYSPYTKFYEGKWWDSGLLLVPFSSWDYTISKSFKYNVSFSGTYQVKGSVLQYQILTGGKILF